MSNGSPGPDPPPKGKVDYEAVEAELDKIINAVQNIHELLDAAKKEK